MSVNICVMVTSQYYKGPSMAMIQVVQFMVPWGVVVIVVVTLASLSPGHFCQLWCQNVFHNVSCSHLSLHSLGPYRVWCSQICSGDLEIIRWWDVHFCLLQITQSKYTEYTKYIHVNSKQMKNAYIRKLTLYNSRQEKKKQKSGSIFPY